jgi:uncharacterized membrane protein
MNNPEDKKPPGSKTPQICAIVFLVIGIVVFQVVAPNLFPTPAGGGINWTRSIMAGVVGGACAALGAVVGLLIDKMR